MRTSIRDVAERAQVSPKTVTNVLRGRSARTSPATRDRVHAAVAALNYIPVTGSTQNRHVETHIIGLVFDHMDQARTYMGTETYLGLREGALHHGYDLLTILQTTPEWARQRPESVFLDRRCDGYIFVNPDNRDDAMRALLANGIPAVSCYNTQVPHGTPSVTLDNETAISLAVQHLTERGHQRIAHLQGMTGHSDIVERAAAFEFAMTAAGLDTDPELSGSALTQVGQFNRATVDRMLATGATAIVSDGTSLAIDFVAAAAARGLRVPDDFSITGIDDSAAALGSNISAATFSCEEVGRTAVELWIAQLQEDDAGVGAKPAAAHPPARKVPVHFLDRGSVEAPRTSSRPHSNARKLGPSN